MDTGASASFISEEHVPQSAVIIPDLNNNIRDLTGKVESIGHIYCNVEITKNFSIFKKLLVISKKHMMPKNVILGADFLAECEGEISFKENVIRGRHKAKNFFKSFSNSTGTENINAIFSDKINMHAEEDIIIPPLSQIIVKGKSSSPNGTYLLTKDFSSKPNLLNGEALINLKNGSGPVLLLNISNNKIKLKKGSIIAKGEKCENPDTVNIKEENIFSVFKDNLDDKKSVGTGELESISSSDIENLVSSDHLEEILPVLNEYRDVIAKKGEPLGRTNILKAEIETGDHAPIYTKQYPMPHSTKEAAKKLFKKFWTKK